MRKILTALVALVLVLSLSLVMAVPVLAAATGHIADNDLGAQLIGMSQTKCIQKVTITNSTAATSLDIDCFAVTNPGGTAVDADVTQVAVYEDTNGTTGTWDAGDTLIGSAASFTLATAIGVNNDTACLSVTSAAPKVVFVVVTTAAAPTDGRTFQTTINGSDLTTGTTETWDGTGGIATATSATTIDAVAPTVAITSTASPGPTNTSPIPMTATFSETVTGFVVGDITVGNGTAGNFAGALAVYTFDVTPTAQGVVTVDIAAGVAQDAAGNGNTAAPQFTITYDSAAPTVAITSTASDPTGTSPIPMTATFSETVTGFALGDITVGNGTASNFVAVSGTVYTFDVTPAAQGVVTVDIAAGVAQDAANNNNTAAPQFTITYSIGVGGTVYPVDKLSILMPWIGLALLLALGAGVVAVRQRQAH